jgi:hypothetical protein
MKRLIVLAILVCGVFSANTFAQKNLKWLGSDGWIIGSSYEQLFNNYNLTVITGTVFDEDTLTPMTNMGRGIRIIVKDQNGQLFPVHLGPYWYIIHQDMNLSIGDEVEVHGARFSLNGKDTYAAYFILMAAKNRELLLRDQDGFPLWEGWRTGSVRSCE